MKFRIALLLALVAAPAFARGQPLPKPTVHNETLGITARVGRLGDVTGLVVTEVTAGMADGTWERMKACRADDCLWAFLDTAKNQSRAWCSMRSCGNREKARVYRERHASH